jgi:rhamnogalacturonyl hydrolase YesR
MTKTKNPPSRPLLALLIACVLPLVANGAPQSAPANDVTAPLHLTRPNYPTPYGQPSPAEITRVLDRIFDYLDAVTPAKVVNGTTKAEITDLNKVDGDTILAPADFRLPSYEWGVTYAGMLAAGAATGEERYTDYAFKRVKLLADLVPHYQARLKADPHSKSPVRGLTDPHALDDIGAICAATVKVKRAGSTANLAPVIDTCSNYISSKEFRLSDGTLARNRPQANTLWLDDMFMGVPALAQLGKLTGERRYYDDAVKQVLQFSSRMFNKDKGIYMHGWVQGMDVHPEFHWARANGWAVMTMVELLDVLPTDHPGYPAVLAQLRAHVKGLASYQDGTGLWHQLLDRNDTYLETSASAIYTYAIARAVNRGYVDKLAYAPVAMLGWNAVSTKVNAKGQVEGTCVGTGMAFDPEFYYYRPVNVYAAHGYGPVLLAGAEILTMIKTHAFEINDSSLQMKVAR